MAPDEQRYLDDRKAKRLAETNSRKREAIIQDAKTAVTQDRNKSYGEPRENHERIAGLWSVILEREVKPHEAALCMAAVKIARLIATPDHRDSWVDGVGYFAIGMECLDDE
tara:strand:+ start:79 stop:411 length:333 start_codon:yes stop_codon:yes gene_type:complete